MKISLSWLRDYLKTEQTAEQLAEMLTRSGIEVKSITAHGATISKVVAAQILESTQHPNADRLSVCKVDEGSGTPRQIVCGAKNYKVGDKILLALPGAVLPGDIKIKVGKLRGVESEGMMCSAKELRLHSDNREDGLLILPSETAVGTELEKLFPADDILELEITPNRPDWLGYLGVAREASVFEAGELVETSIKLPPMSEAKDVAIITALNACSFYSVRRIDNIMMNPSPSWLVQRLAVMEARSINLVVDVANYVMFEMGQPLHAFDAGKLKGALNIRFAHEGEKLEALDGKTYQLRSSDLIIADENGPQALAGIIGGVNSSVTEATTSVLLESAVFDAATIAASIRFHGIHTEAGYRFERGNRAGTLEASARAAKFITELGCAVTSEKLFITGELPSPLEIELKGDQVRRLLGAELSNEQIDSYLKKLGFIKKEHAWLVPAWRSDVHRPVDLIEEVARTYGIEAIEPRCMGFPASSSKEDRLYDQIMGLRRKLAAAGFFEARTGTLVAKETASETSISLRNPMGEQQAVLRTSLLPNLEKVLQHNFQQGATTIRLFEVGKIYQQTSSTSEEEKISLALIMAGEAVPTSWRKEGSRALDLYDLKEIIKQLLPGRISFESWQESLPNEMILMMRVLCDQEYIGNFGILHPSLARELMLTGQEYPVIVAELNGAALCNLVKQADRKKEGMLPRFPAIIRDLALLVNKSVSYASLEDVLLSAKEELLRSITPFDVFVDSSGEKISAEKKSIALSLKFQHSERTLTAQEVNEACERLIGLLENSLQAEVRK